MSIIGFPAQRVRNALPIGTAVIGAGYFGKLHARSYLQLPSSRLDAIIDPDPETRTFAERIGVPWFAAPDALPDSVRAVSVATPVDTHYPIARKLLERGIDVLLEKPIAETLEQAADLRALASSRGRLLQIGHIERFNPAFAAAAGVLRQARCIRAYRASEHRPRHAAMDVVVDLMIHDLDLVLSQHEARIVELRAEGCSHGYTPIDEARAQLTFANGCRVEFDARWGVASVVNSERRMMIELADGVWTLDFRQRQAGLRGNDGTIEIENAAVASPHDQLML
ncbi:MAG TPA: Gfo/Idh/MocA family oxidoreductase, partial [Rudaea sp.]